jgi:ClpP class serine protease
MWFVNDELKAKLEKIEARSSELDAETYLSEPKEDRIFKGVVGTLVDEPMPWFDLFGVEYTVYSDIIRYIDQENLEDTSEPIYLDFNSGGGVASNDFLLAIEAIKESRREIVAVVHDCAASAAYMLASQASKICAMGEFSMVGSVGVAVDLYASDEESLSITNRESKDKRPDYRTSEGIEVLQDQLDSMFEVVKSKIVESRPELKNSDFGKGRMFIAEEALNLNLIDQIRLSSEAKEDQPKKGNITMNLDKIKADHPDLANQLRAEGANQAKINATQAIEDFKNETLSHLKMAESSGNFEYAIQCIQGGVSFSDEVAIKHMNFHKENKESQDKGSHKILAEKLLSNNQESNDIAAMEMSEKSPEIKGDAVDQMARNYKKKEVKR